MLVAVTCAKKKKENLKDESVFRTVSAGGG